MDGESAATTRLREEGRICCGCSAPLGTPPPVIERFCSRCEPRRKVYLYYMRVSEGWRCTFLQPDLKTPFGRRLIFQTPEKVMALAMRGGADNSLAGRQAIEYGIRMGRGSAWLLLTDEQYRKLR
jgi:hypothetical protein